MNKDYAKEKIIRLFEKSKLLREYEDLFELYLDEIKISEIFHTIKDQRALNIVLKNFNYRHDEEVIKKIINHISQPSFSFKYCNNFNFFIRNQKLSRPYINHLIESRNSIKQLTGIIAYHNQAKKEDFLNFINENKLLLTQKIINSKTLKRLTSEKKRLPIRLIS